MILQVFAIKIVRYLFRKKTPINGAILDVFIRAKQQIQTLNLFARANLGR